MTEPLGTDCPAGSRKIDFAVARGVTTRATATLQGLADAWERLYDTARFSGIVGDPAHQDRGGYHISIQANPAGNYSITRPDDKAPPGTWPRDCSSAIDMNLGLADMKLCHGRLVEVWRNRDQDPRARFINAHNGWDGQGSPGRYDWVTGAVSTASADHAWHVHLELRRRYVDDPKAAAAVLSILAGESVADFLEEDQMTPAQFVTLLNDPTVAARMRALAGQGVHQQKLGASSETIGQDLQSDDNSPLLARLTDLQDRVAGLERVTGEIRDAVVSPPPPGPSA
jgi:hypothetical protein